MFGPDNQKKNIEINRLQYFGKPDPEGTYIKRETRGGEEVGGSATI